MKQKFMYLFLLLLSVFLILSCKNNSFNSKKNDTYYEDVNFIDFTGQKIISGNHRETSFQIEKKDYEINLKVFISPNLQDKVGSGEFNEIFKIENDYLYKYEEYNEDDPSIKIKEYFYFKDGVGIKYHLSFQNGKSSNSSVSKIDFRKKEIEEFEYESFDINPSSNFDFSRSNNKNAIFFNKTNIEIKNKKLHLIWKSEDLQTNKIEIINSYYEGFPNSEINNYWNLYKQFYGSEIDNVPN